MKKTEKVREEGQNKRAYLALCTVTESRRALIYSGSARLCYSRARRELLHFLSLLRGKDGFLAVWRRVAGGTESVRIVTFVLFATFARIALLPLLSLLLVLSDSDLPDVGVRAVLTGPA